MSSSTQGRIFFSFFLLSSLCMWILFKCSPAWCEHKQAILICVWILNIQVVSFEVVNISLPELLLLSTTTQQHIIDTFHLPSKKLHFHRVIEKKKKRKSLSCSYANSQLKGDGKKRQTNRINVWLNTMKVRFFHIKRQANDSKGKKTEKKKFIPASQQLKSVWPKGKHMRMANWTFL